MTSSTVKSPDERHAGAPARVLEPEATMTVHEVRLHLPTRIFGECAADHQQRGAPNWSDAPEVMPLGEEGGTAWTPDNSWLHEEEETAE